jgi:pimeloyl-ACP methyl ester carboxylesterase
MIAPLLAAEQAVDRIIVYGTSARRWLDIMEDTTQRQRLMVGVSETQAAAEVGQLRERALSEGLNGRSSSYHRQLHERDLHAAWQGAQCERVLVVRGEHDWVVTPEEQAEIARLCPAAVDVIDVPGLDHLFGWHPDRATSLRHYGEGHYGPEAAREMLAWLAGSPVMLNS